MTIVAETPTFQPGIYDAMPEEEYHADPVPEGSLSFSGAKKLLPPSCPAKFRYEQDHPVHKDVFDFGSAAHKLVLGSGPRIAVIDAANWMTKAAKEAREDARAVGSIPLLAAEYQQVQEMAAAIRAHPVASYLFDPSRGGKPEQSMFWQDGDTGVWRRCRLDFMPPSGQRGRLIIPDYKTTHHADPASIAKSVASFGYYQQDAWYTDAVRAMGYDDDPAFVFCFQEKTPPYLVSVVQLDDEAREAGRAVNRLALEVFRDCREAGIWPGYSQEIELVSLPPWALRQLETL